MGYSSSSKGVDSKSSITNSSTVPTQVPVHVAFIVDGSGRWAERQGMERPEGHASGANVTVEVVKAAFDMGVEVVTLFLFSTENWKRPPGEVGNIMNLLALYLRDFSGYLRTNDISLKVIGQTWRLPSSLQQLLTGMCDDGIDTDSSSNDGSSTSDRSCITSSNIGSSSSGKDVRDPGVAPRTSGAAWPPTYAMFEDAYRRLFRDQGMDRSTSVSGRGPPSRRGRKVLCLAISYGGRLDIVEASKQLAQQVSAGALRPEDITEDLFAQHTMTGLLGLPDPDVIIRTSGEMRVSNFLLWQCAYSEFVAVDKLWPDFSAAEAVEVIRRTGSRKRRFGGVVGGKSEPSS